MSVLLGSARIDENGAAHGGQAGDQNGKEVSTQAWYKHTKGWVLLRAKDAQAREKIAACMEAACANSHIGYDQYQRDTLYNEAKQYGFDCAKVAKNVETDCSALVRVCVNYAGITVGNFRTTNEATVLMNTGAFVKYTDSLHTTKSTNVLRGDILVTKTQGHTVVVLSDGANAKDEAPANLGERELKKGMTGADVSAMQEALSKLGYNIGTCGIDGDFGSDTEKALKVFQYNCMLPVSGIYDAETHKALMDVLGALADKPNDNKDAPAPIDPAADTVTVTGGSVNVRTGNGTNYPTVGIARKGEVYELIATAKNGWHAIKLGDTVGWISGLYANVKGGE